MRRFAVVGVAVSIGVLAFAPSALAASARVAALQVGLRAHGFDPGPVDGVRGGLTTNALLAFQRANGIRATAICPGLVATSMVTESRAPRDEMIQPEDIAKTILWLLDLSPQVVIREVVVERTGVV